MCLAVREWEAEAKRIGHEEGLKEGHKEGLEKGLKKGFKKGQTTIIRNMIRRGDSDEEIVQVAECDRKYVARLRRTMQ